MLVELGIDDNFIRSDRSHLLRVAYLLLEEKKIGEWRWGDHLGLVDFGLEVIDESFLLGGGVEVEELCFLGHAEAGEQGGQFVGLAEGEILGLELEDRSLEIWWEGFWGFAENEIIILIFF